jgi:hypothetical protein
MHTDKNSYSAGEFTPRPVRWREPDEHPNICVHLCESVARISSLCQIRPWPMQFENPPITPAL